MRKIITLVIAFLINIFAFAQEPGAYWGFGIGSGLAGFQYTVKDGSEKIGVGFNGGFNFSYYFSRHWGIGTGLQLATYSTKGTFDQRLFSFQNQVDDENYIYRKDIYLNRWDEKQKAVFFEIPLLAQFQHKFGPTQQFGMYAGLGAKLQIPITASYKVDGNEEVQGYYEQWHTTLYNLPQHGFDEKDNGPSGDLSLKTGIAATAELGFLYTISPRTDFYAGVYADYGLTTINTTTPDKDIIFIDNSGQDAYQSMLTSRAAGDANTIALQLKLGLRFHLINPKKDDITKQGIDTTQTNVYAHALNVDSSKLADMAYLKDLEEFAKPTPFYGASATELTQEQKDFLDKKVAILNRYPKLDFNLSELSTPNVPMDIRQRRMDTVEVYLRRHRITPDTTSTQPALAYTNVSVPVIGGGDVSKLSDPQYKADLLELNKPVVFDGKENVTLTQAHKDALDKKIAAWNKHPEWEIDFNEMSSDNVPENIRQQRVDSVKAYMMRNRNPKPDDQTIVQVTEPVVGKLPNQSEMDILLTPIDHYGNSVSNLDARQRGELDDKIAILKKYPNINVRLEGHTCDLGSDSLNMRIGLQRADKVYNYMVNHGIDKARLQPLSKGETDHVVPNSNEENRKRNRRVEFPIIRTDKPGSTGTTGMSTILMPVTNPNQSMLGNAQYQKDIAQLSQPVIFYGTTATQLTPEQIADMKRKVELLKKYPDLVLKINNQNTQDVSPAVATQREAVVVNYFKEQGIASNRIAGQTTGDKTVVQVNSTGNGNQPSKEELDFLLTPIDHYGNSHSVMNGKQQGELDEKIAILKKFPNVNITLEGHTCDLGADDMNMKLGLRRAIEVRDYMIGHGIDAKRLKVTSKGETDHVVPNKNEENRLINRRVEFLKRP